MFFGAELFVARDDAALESLFTARGVPGSAPWRDFFDAAEALRIGLVTRVVSPGEVNGPLPVPTAAADSVSAPGGAAPVPSDPGTVDHSAQLAQAVKSGQPVELVDKRSEVSKTFVTPASPFAASPHR